MTSIQAWLGKGLTPQGFIDWMSKNQETFKDNYGKVTFNEADEAFFNTFNRDGVRCAIIASDWCGDVVRNVPVVFQFMEQAGIPTEVFILEENDELIQPFLLYGGKSIPVVLLTNEKGEVIYRWGPRPAYVQQPMADFKALNLDRESDEYKEKVKDVYAEMMKRYGEGTGYYRYIIDEFKDVLGNL
ncbi:thioredoxin family protein [Pullulanibacillus sp. KACC 23026]|uniref:thioredoxin family protein n=1 Tax=Pullulanibacillus sp. KACC 23026 TaxID=3028315 RepID=UPI0023B076C7|nr:thioredoxin family protein [Pullulanibacillus sp. KACC 23026]WEG13031.1 thioredoxin family protein [Pullulanibacillus sp. KACC 23026]